MTNWMALSPMDIGIPGSPVRANGGAGADALQFRNPLDAARSAKGARVPSAEYPDGYLGTIQSRREDRLLDGIKNRLTQRSYQRGVHKGEKVDPGDYVWPEELQPTAGLEYQARGLKWSTRGTPVERVTYGLDASPAERAALQAQTGINGMPANQIDPLRAERLKRLLPTYR